MNIPPIIFDEEPQSPENIRFRNVTLKLNPDGRRVKVGITFTPSIAPPNIEITVQDENENRVANASIIGASSPNLEMTLHLRGDLRSSEYKFLLTLGFQENAAVDCKEVTLRMPSSDIQSHGMKVDL